MMKFIKLFGILLLVLIIVGCQQTEQRPVRTFYVDSMDGSDHNKGSIESPLQSLNAVNQLDLIPGDVVLFRADRVYRGQLFPQSGDQEAHILYSRYDKGPAPVLMGSIEANDPSDWDLIGHNIYQLNEEVLVDIGNIIFNDGESFGIKQWDISELTNANDYVYDSKNKRLLVYSEDNPGKLYHDIELALNLDIIDETGISYVTYEGLSLTYGGAHGIGGGNTSHITIRDLEISFIGGGYLYQQNGVNVRYGNGIEFWANASHNLVENCEIYEIFDSGVTNQNNGKKAIHDNIIYRHNIIYGCGMASFEVDNEPESGLIRDVYFIDNECSDVGAGWAATQDRYKSPEENLGLGHHVVSYYISTPIEHLVIADNTFHNGYNSSEVSSVYFLSDIDEGSRDGILIENNESRGEFDYLGIVLDQGNRYNLSTDELVSWLSQ